MSKGWPNLKQIRLLVRPEPSRTKCKLKVDFDNQLIYNYIIMITRTTRNENRLNRKEGDKACQWTNNSTSKQSSLAPRTKNSRRKSNLKKSLEPSPPEKHNESHTNGTPWKSNSYSNVPWSSRKRNLNSSLTSRLEACASALREL